MIHGLDAAGKTTLLYMFKLGEVVTTIPTIGMNVETISYKNTYFTTWDIGGRDKKRVMWYYFQGLRGGIFVVDSSDRERIEYAAEELQGFLDGNEDIPVLIFANKQDKTNAMSGTEVAENLHLHTLPVHRAWHVQECCATTGAGLYEGLEWLYASTRVGGALRQDVRGPSRCKLPDLLSPQSWLSALSAVGAAIQGTVEQSAASSQKLLLKIASDTAFDGKSLAADVQKASEGTSAATTINQAQQALGALDDPKHELLVDVFGS